MCIYGTRFDAKNDWLWQTYTGKEREKPHSAGYNEILHNVSTMDLFFKKSLSSSVFHSLFFFYFQCVA